MAEILDDRSATVNLGGAKITHQFLQAFEETCQAYQHMWEKHQQRAIDGEIPYELDRLAALVEEVGEVAKTLTYDGKVSDRRAELIQVANVALAWASIL